MSGVARTRVVRAAMVAMLAGAAATGAGYGLAASSAQSGGALGPGTVVVQLDVHHSRFEPESLRVREGTLVRFVVHNGDPIRHELIVGPPDVHARHESGTEATHPPVPGEVTVDPSEVAETVYRFDEPGDVVFACHLPGHLQYGMRGTVEVLPID